MIIFVGNEIYHHRLNPSPRILISAATGAIPSCRAMWAGLAPVSCIVLWLLVGFRVSSRSRPMLRITSLCGASTGRLLWQQLGGGSQAFAGWSSVHFDRRALSPPHEVVACNPKRNHDALAQSLHRPGHNGDKLPPTGMVVIGRPSVGRSWIGQLSNEETDT